MHNTTTTALIPMIWATIRSRRLFGENTSSARRGRPLFAIPRANASEIDEVCVFDAVAIAIISAAAVGVVPGDVVRRRP